MIKRICLLICALTMVIAALCACSADPEPKDPVRPAETETTAPKTTNPPPQETAAPETTEAPTQEPSAAPTEPELTGMLVSEDLERIFATDMSMWSKRGEGFVYRDDDTKLYGILSVDGTYDSGARYYDVGDCSAFFSVTLSKPEDPNNLDEINNTGLVDGYGNVIIPPEYAIIKSCQNARFFQVIKVTERTDNKDEALVFLTSRFFALTASDEDILYKGVWYIFDTETGKVIDGVSATNAYSPGVTGDKVSYVDDNENRVSVNTKGQPFPEGVQLFEDGSYYDAASGNVCDAFGSVLFSFDEEKYDYIGMSSGYYRCNRYESGTTYYVYLDRSGKEITPVYQKPPYIYGDSIVVVDSAAYDLAGNLLVEGPVSNVQETDHFWYLYDYDTGAIYILDKEFQLRYTGNKNNGESFWSSSGCLEKKDGDKNLFYSFAEEDFIYEGYSVGYGYVSVRREDGTEDLINTLTGETVMSGFEGYTVDEGSDGKLYFFASYQTEDWTRITVVYEMR